MNGPDAAFALCLAYFVFKLCFFATNVNPAIPPDELDRIELSYYFQEEWGLSLPDSPQTYHLSQVSRKPPLYFWLMGRLLQLNVFNIPGVLYLRCINIALSIIAIFVAYAFLRLVSPQKWIAPAGIFVLTNIPMYSFLGAFVSYDNLVNLLSVCAFYFFIRYIRSRRGEPLMALGISILLGTLTKISVVPLAVIFGVAIFFNGVRCRHSQKPEQVFAVRPRNAIIGGIVLLLLLGMNLNVYGVNLARYGRLEPSCTQVLTLEQCQEHPNFNIYTDLRRKAKKVPAQLRDTPPDYFWRWQRVMQAGIFGIFGHRLMFKNSWEMFPYSLLVLVFLGSLIRHLKWKDTESILLLFCVTAYAGVLCYYVHYPTYVSTNYLLASLQGRYLFPVIVPLVYLFTYYLLGFGPRLWKGLLLAGILAVFLWGDWPYFLQNAGPQWYLRDIGQLYIYP